MQQIAMSLGMAILISVLTYITKVQKGESFDAYKVLRTLVIGLVIGGIAYYKGFTITPENWEAYLTSNMGIVAVLDQGWKMVWRLIGGKNTLTNN